MPSSEPHDLLPPEITVLERGWLSANNILFIGQHDTAIVDTGYCSHADQTVDLVRGTLQAEAALSNHDRNRFSPLGRADNQGMAAFVGARQPLLPAELKP